MGDDRGRITGSAQILLDQHEQLQILALELVQAARTARSEGTAKLTALARDLADGLAAHNRLEESVLEPFLLTRDRWSSVRVTEMIDDHRQEHESFVAELRAVARADAPTVELEARVFELAAALFRHMEREEIEYLNVDLVRDERPTGPEPRARYG